MVSREVVVEAKSLEEARQLLASKVPDGFYKVSEKVVSDGTAKKAVTSGANIAGVLKQAQNAVPANAVIQDKKVQSESKRSFDLKAFDESEVKHIVKQKLAQYESIGTLHLKTKGWRGFLGIGRKPDIYTATIVRAAIVEIVYVAPAKIVAKIRLLPSKDAIISSLSDLEKQTAEQWLRLDKPVQGAIVALMVMHGAFQFLKEKVSEPFNEILAEAKVLFPTNWDIQNMAPLQLGPPVVSYDVGDIHLVSQQFKDALAQIRKIKELIG